GDQAILCIDGAGRQLVRAEEAGRADGEGGTVGGVGPDAGVRAVAAHAVVAGPRRGREVGVTGRVDAALPCATGDPRPAARPAPAGPPRLRGGPCLLPRPPAVWRARVHAAPRPVPRPVAVVVAPLADLREARLGKRVPAPAIVRAAHHREARVRQAD